MLLTRFVLILFILILIVSNINGQILDTNMTHMNCESLKFQNSQYDDNSYYDKSAHYPGGEKEMNKFIYDNLNFPKNAINTHGIYFVNILLDSLGVVTNACILRPINPYPYGEIIIERIKKMPKWTPAYKNHTPIPSHYNIPVKFCTGR